MKSIVFSLVVLTLAVVTEGYIEDELQVDCVGPPIDPKPYAPLSDYDFLLIINDTSLDTCYLSNYVNAVLSFSCTSPPDEALIASNINSLLLNWGYNASIASWDNSSPLSPVAFLSFGGLSSYYVPIFRVFLLPLGISVVSNQTTQIETSAGDNVWNTDNITAEERISFFFFNFPPADPSYTSNVFTNWFCYNGWNVTTEFANLDDINATTLDEAPQIIISEYIPPVNACAAKTDLCIGSCINGFNPPDGYTCAGPTGIVYQVDSHASEIFDIVSALVSKLFGVGTTGISNSVVSGTLVTGQIITYSIALNTSIPNGAFYVDSLLPSIQSLIAPFNPQRLDASYVSPQTINIVIDYPGQVTVSFLASGTGLLYAREVVLSLSQLVSGSVNPIVAISTQNSNISVNFQEDVSTINTTIYRTSACTFFKAISQPANQATFSQTTGRTVYASSVVTTDKSCVISSGVPSGSDSGVIAAIVVVVILILAMMLAGYLYLRHKKNQKKRPVEEF